MGDKVPFKRRNIKINPRQMQVVDEYFSNGFKKQDALDAVGFHGNGGSDRFFKRSYIIAEIEKRQAKLRKKYELDEDWIIQRIMKLADANVGEILIKLQDYDYDLSVLDQDELFAISEFTEEVYTEGRGHSAQEVKKVKFKTESKMTALITLCRKMGLFTDHLKVSGEVSIVERLQAGRNRTSADQPESD